MRKIVVPILLLLVVSLLGACASDRPTMEEQEHCAARGQDVLRQNPLSSSQADLGSQTHYNPQIRVCALLRRYSERKDGGTELTEYVTDAYEGRDIGVLNVSTVPGEKMICQVTLPSGEAKECKGVDEFREVTKQYLY